MTKREVYKCKVQKYTRKETYRRKKDGKKVTKEYPRQAITLPAKANIGKDAVVMSIDCYNELREGFGISIDSQAYLSEVGRLMGIIDRYQGRINDLREENQTLDNKLKKAYKRIFRIADKIKEEGAEIEIEEDEDGSPVIHF